MLIINVKNGKIDAALKEFKRKVKQTKQTQMVRELQEFQKPSVKRRLKKQKAIYKQRMRDHQKD
jgi:small subunit ribosomal protein S21